MHTKCLLVATNLTNIFSTFAWPTQNGAPLPSPVPTLKCRNTHTHTHSRMPEREWSTHIPHPSSASHIIMLKTAKFEVQLGFGRTFIISLQWYGNFCCIWCHCQFEIRCVGKFHIYAMTRTPKELFDGQDTTYIYTHIDRFPSDIHTHLLSDRVIRLCMRQFGGMTDAFYPMESCHISLLFIPFGAKMSNKQETQKFK